MRPNFVSRVQHSFKLQSKTKPPPSVYRDFLRAAVYVASGCLATFCVSSRIDYGAQIHCTDRLFKELFKVSSFPRARDPISCFYGFVGQCVGQFVADSEVHATYGDLSCWSVNANL